MRTTVIDRGRFDRPRSPPSVSFGGPTPERPCRPYDLFHDRAARLGPDAVSVGDPSLNRRGSETLARRSRPRT
ncbi:hypothetical protein DJ82_09390 [Halorubrum sp. Ib24]|nr:hypothetical protein DJ82_09390 [Halorubrum sp. Ib24]OYR45230.1 hypothetical protein DJ75_08330 [Halorubrum sp. Eb13]OYR46578.1 hypothetical protein DJ74_14940 [Halorubrum sp. Ea8]OYR55169.1 hypothetical protein DJ73_03525 [Halorubrum sp. Ea1]